MPDRNGSRNGRPPLVWANIIGGDSLRAGVRSSRRTGDARVEVISHGRQRLIDVVRVLQMGSMAADVGDREPRIGVKLTLNAKAPALHRRNIINRVQVTQGYWCEWGRSTGRRIIEWRLEESRDAGEWGIANQSICVVALDTMVT